MIYYNEEGSIQLIKDILEEGVEIPSRAGNCKALFGVTLEYDTHCLSTIRPSSFRLAFEEMIFFLRGQTDSKILEDKGVNFWKGNTTKEFLKQRGLGYLNEGEMGAAYSLQWRDSGGYIVYASQKYGKSKSVGGVDQLEMLIDNLENDRYGRRNLVMLWNPSENDHKCLTECWYSSDWNVLPNKDGEDELHVLLSNRSLDTIFGLNFAIQNYRFLQIALCKMFGFKLGKLRCSVSHAHIYEDQIEYAKELVERVYGKQGEIIINSPLHSLEDLLSLEWEDIEVKGLEVNTSPFITPRPKMAV